MAAIKQYHSDYELMCQGMMLRSTKLSNKHCNIGAIGADTVVNKLDVVSFLVNFMTKSLDDKDIINTGFNLLNHLAEIKTLRGKLIESGAIRGIAIIVESTLTMLASSVKPLRPCLLSCILNSNDGYMH